MGGDVAQLVERPTDTPLDSLVLQGIFLPELTFNADSLMVSVHPLVQSNTFTSMHTLKIL